MVVLIIVYLICFFRAALDGNYVCMYVYISKIVSAQELATKLRKDNVS